MTELPDIATQADEASTLRQFLDYYRVVLLRKTEGLTDDQARIALAPSDLTLGKLLRHMTLVEGNWGGPRLKPELTGFELTLAGRDASWTPGLREGPR